MYSITDIFIIQCLFFLIVFNSKGIVNYCKKQIPNKLKDNFNKLIGFYDFICENNPLILDYSDKQDTENICDEKNNETKEETVNVIKFEDKYLDRFKKFPNEFKFTEDELEQEIIEYEKIKIECEKNRLDRINSIQEKLFKIKEIQEKGNINHKQLPYTKNINKLGIDMLIKFFDIDDDSNDIDVEQVYQDLLQNKEELLKQMDETEKMSIHVDDIRKQARDIIINKRLDKYIDNYILEPTPLGNICMRYNNDKKSFEYFSNNSIPYRYLEPVGRKYVMTYWCKPIFVDIDEELKKAEEKYDEEKKKREDDEKKLEEERKLNPKVLVKLKNYNKERKDVAIRPMKNRSNTNAILPPQIKANLPDVNKPSEKQLLKENANRYTWEGRLSSFCPLKTIDRKLLDKKLAMTYADFKKMQKG